MLVMSLSLVKSVRVRSYSDPYFPAFGLNTERYGVSLHIQSKCGKIWTRMTRDKETFYAVSLRILSKCRKIWTRITPNTDIFYAVYFREHIPHASKYKLKSLNNSDDNCKSLILDRCGDWSPSSWTYLHLVSST